MNRTRDALTSGGGVVGGTTDFVLLGTPTGATPASPFANAAKVSLLKFLALPIAGLLSLPAALAHCPVCTAAAGVTLAAARFYGVDDIITGVLLGAFLVSTALWMHNIIVRKWREFFPMQSVAIIVASLLLTVVSFWIGGLFPEADIHVLGMSRLLAGMVFGTIASSMAFVIHHMLRARNNNENYVPLQGVIAALTSSLITILVVYYAVGVVA